MKNILLLAIAILFTQQALGQNNKIDNKNYYDFYYKPGPSAKFKLKGKSITTKWLGNEDVVPILLDELKKEGYEWVVDNRLYHLDSAKYVVLSAFSQKSNFGFLYVQGHDAFPILEHRHQRGIDLTFGHFDYQQVFTNSSGKNNWMRIKKLPDNILMLSENWYWYQSTDDPDDSKYLLTREDIIRVLRQDIRDKLNSAPKPTKY